MLTRARFSRSPFFLCQFNYTSCFTNLWLPTRNILAIRFQFSTETCITVFSTCNLFCWIFTAYIYIYKHNEIFLINFYNDITLWWNKARNKRITLCKNKLMQWIKTRNEVNYIYTHTYTQFGKLKLGIKRVIKATFKIAWHPEMKISIHF